MSIKKPPLITTASLIRGGFLIDITVITMDPLAFHAAKRQICSETFKNDAFSKGESSIYEAYFKKFRLRRYLPYYTNIRYC